MNYFILIAVLVMVDQVLKYLAQAFLKPISTFPLVQNVFHLTYGENTGAVFSILQGKQTFLIMITSLVTLFLIVYLIQNYKSQNRLLLISLTFIISGALGNLTDRIRLNYVVDFFDFNLVNYPIFNMADVFIVSGSIYIAYFVLLSQSINSRKMKK